MNEDDFLRVAGALLELAASVALLVAIPLALWAVVNPDQLLMMAERVFGITCEDLPEVLC